MRLSIFLSIFITVYGSVNFYIFFRGWQALPKAPHARILYVIIFLFICLSYFAGRILERFSICTASGLFIWIGSFWLGLMLYIFLGILLMDILRLFNHFISFFPPVVTINHEKSKLIAAIAVIALSLITVIAGYVNARIPEVKKIELTIPKNAGSLKSLHIAMASDIHLGIIISNSHLEKLVNSVNDLKPDIVLLAGDIVDEDLAPVIKNNLGETLRRFRSRYGTYAVTGNHEYIGGVEAAVKYLTEHDITMLRDRAVKIDGNFYLAGREDRSVNRFSGRERKSLEDILAGTDRALPVILMDHQPFSLHQAAEAGADLQLSGHTHNGQLWPFNFMTSAIFELSRGYIKIADAHFYVSSGYGTWGPPVRTSARPEIVDIMLHFKK